MRSTNRGRRAGRRRQQSSLVWVTLSAAAVSLAACRFADLPPPSASAGDPHPVAAFPDDPAGPRGLGTLVVSIAWPERSVHVIPTSTQWIRLQVLKGDTKLVEAQLSRPTGAGGSLTSQASLLLDAGANFDLQADAFRLEASATGDTPIATARRSGVSVKANERTAVTMAMVPALVPTLSSFSPTNGGPGVTLTLVGTFGVSGYYGVDIGGTRGVGIASGSTAILAGVPADAKTGPVSALDDGVPSLPGATFSVLIRLDLAPSAATVSNGAAASFTVPTAVDTASKTIANPTLTRWEVVDPLQPADPLAAATGIGAITSGGLFTAKATGSAWIRVLSGALAATAAIVVK
jgi:hypothetical protein